MKKNTILEHHTEKSVKEHVSNKVDSMSEDVLYYSDIYLNSRNAALQNCLLDDGRVGRNMYQNINFNF
jgi:hypothetical protein